MDPTTNARSTPPVVTDRHVTNEEPDEPWAKVPEALLYDPEMSDKACRLYGVLRRHGDDPSNCYPSKRRLADLMGCASSSLGRPLRELEDAGWIERVARTHPNGDPDSNGYFVRLVPRTSSAGYAQENTDRARSGAQGVRAGERAEREPLNESQGNDLPPPPVALEVTDKEHPEYGFDKFWAVYPARNGKKVGKAKTLAKWRRFSYDTKARAYLAARNYGAAVAQGLTIAKDPERFVANGYFEDWLDGAGSADAAVAKPTPVDSALAAAAAERDRTARRQAGEACPTCEDRRIWENPEDGLVYPCPACRSVA